MTKELESIVWPGLKGDYPGSAGGDGYTMAGGSPIILSHKDKQHPLMREAPD